MKKFEVLYTEELFSVKLSPEQKLLQAVLLRAVHDLYTPMIYTKSAALWFLGRIEPQENKETYPEFTFDAICDTFSISSRVRDLLKRDALRFIQGAPVYRVLLPDRKRE